MKTSPIKIVASPIVHPIYEPEINIVNMYVDSVTNNDETTWFLHLVNYDGRIFDYKLTVSMNLQYTS